MVLILSPDSVEILNPTMAQKSPHAFPRFIYGYENRQLKTMVPYWCDERQ